MSRMIIFGGRRSCTLSFDGLAAANPTHGGIASQTVGIVHVVISTKPAIKGLTELPRHAVPCVVGYTVVAENIPGHLGKLESVIEFSVGKKTSVSGDLGAVELQLQAAVEIDPMASLFSFTHRVCHIRCSICSPTA